ncbi:MAG: hypothetical protein QOI20_2188 [Acidimicrobiaceae bacterium]|jgi:NAD(P)-dependent dehydrogenase (short-subunit alcohol dehydrogenase family)|nr:hypothetical protein [Acidimicrobiaceae bacterium]
MANRLGGRVLVLLDNGSEHGAHVARALAQAGASVLTVHGQGRPPEGRGLFSGDGGDPLDVGTATTMATELFGPVDAVLDVADLPDGDPDALMESVERRLQGESGHGAG